MTAGGRRAGRAILFVALAAAIVVAAIGWWLTAPIPLDANRLAALAPGDPSAGARIFHAGGCNSCHAAEKAEGDDKRKLGGGLELPTPFGTFVAPNISPHPRDGIGGWSLEDFANAMLRGIGPGGRHYYPAFPYGSYARMTLQDVADLYAYMRTLPAVAGTPPDHDLSFPFTIRRGVGLWKTLYLDDAPVVAADGLSEQARRGRYLVEGPGHCGECHTPRDPAGGPKTEQWLAGAPDPEGGEGIVPNITPHADGLADWSAADIAYYLESGFTPTYDTVGGSMVAVQENMAKLPAADREAIAAYLKSVPARPNGYAAGE